MCQLFETIKVENRRFFNLDLHTQRLNKSRKDLYNAKTSIILEDVLKIPSYIDKELYKCRVVYDDEIKKIAWIKYKAKEIKLIKVVKSDDIEYSHKYINRSAFEILLKENGCGESEEILIIKNGRVTDTSYSNVALYDGNNWYTPMYPLLKGTKRAKLLEERKIIERDILANELKLYQKIILINALLDFEDANLISVEDLDFTF